MSYLAKCLGMLVSGQNLQPSTILNRAEGFVERVLRFIAVVVFIEKGNYSMKVQFPISWCIENFMRLVYSNSLIPGPIIDIPIVRGPKVTNR
jgi:hypothetical protein